MTSDEKRKLLLIDSEPAAAIITLLTHTPSPSKTLKRFRTAYDNDKEPHALRRHAYVVMVEFMSPDTAS